LLLGCVATLLICYGNVIYEIVAWDEPLHYFLRHRHLNHEFTEIADTHPAYLGVFMACSTAYLLFESSIKKQLKVAIIVFFTFAMIQLASRMAFVSFGLIVLIFALLRLKKYWKQILIGLGAALICGALLFASASEFLRDRLVNTENFENDKRFSRNIVSWEIFKEYPLIGVGFGRKDALRKTKYEAYGFKIASENKSNAHNQYLEYLSVNGLLGGVIFIAIVIYLLYVSWKRRSILFFVIFSVFFIANLTESMLVRIKGIEFFAITVSLLATITMKLKENEHINNP
jgi:O-antigen ligase